MAADPDIRKLDALAEKRDTLEAEDKLTRQRLDELEAAARKASGGMRDALAGYDAARGRLLERQTPPLPRWVWRVAGLIPALGFVWYLRTLFGAEWKDIPHWGALGDAVGPFAGLMSSAAVLIAIYSIQLQRRELTMQREELRLQRKEMADSRAELAKAADAQAELAKAQRAMVEAQSDANTTALYMEQATRRATVATLTVALAEIRASRFGMATSQMSEMDRDEKMVTLLMGIENLANFDLARLSEIAVGGRLGGSEATRTAMTLEALAAWQAGLTRED